MSYSDCIAVFMCNDVDGIHAMAQGWLGELSDEAEWNYMVLFQLFAAMRAARVAA